LFRNGTEAPGSPASVTSAAVPGANSFIIGDEGGVAYFSDDTIQAAGFGAGLTQPGGGTTGPGLSYRINQYMIAVGAAWHY
jgi:hypothetical protein